MIFWQSTFACVGKNSSFSEEINTQCSVSYGETICKNRGGYMQNPNWAPGNPAKHICVHSTYILHRTINTLLRTNGTPLRTNSALLRTMGTPISPWRTSSERTSELRVI